MIWRKQPMKLMSWAVAFSFVLWFHLYVYSQNVFKQSFENLCLHKVIKVKLQLNERFFAYYRAQQTNLFVTLSMTIINQGWRVWISIIILINIFSTLFFVSSTDTKYTFYTYFVGDSKYVHPESCWMPKECLALSHFWAGL